MRIESRRNQQQLRLKAFQRGQPMLCDGGAKFLSLCSGGKRSVDDMVVAALCSEVWIKWMLKSGTQHDARFVVKNVFRAIAVMYVEIRNRHALQAILRQCMRRADCDIVENAESHGTGAFGMVAGR